MGVLCVARWLTLSCAKAAKKNMKKGGRVMRCIFGAGASCYCSRLLVFYTNIFTVFENITETP